MKNGIPNNNVIPAAVWYTEQFISLQQASQNKAACAWFLLTSLAYATTIQRAGETHAAIIP